MNYEQMLDEVEGLGFLRNREFTAQAVKTCLALIISRLSRDEAELLLDYLPVPFSYQDLRMYGRSGVSNNTVREDIVDIALSLHLNFDQAHALMNCVMHVVKNTVGNVRLQEIERLLPPDWVAAFEAA